MGQFVVLGMVKMFEKLLLSEELEWCENNE